MLRKIKLYGELAKFLGEKTFEAEVHTAAQAIRFLVVNFPQLEKHMADRYYKVAIDNWELEEKELHYPNGQEDIKIIPVVGGEGGRGIGKVLLGAALIGGAFLFTPLTTSAFFAGSSTTGSFAAAGAITQAAVYVGASLVLQGVADMLTPVPKISESEQDPRLSFNFSGIQNTSRAGVAVPVIYGEVLTGSVVISAGIETAQVEV
jgi:predicted phage tail protein